MPYQNTAAQFRPELHAVVEEAAAIDKKFIGDALFPVFPVKTRVGDYVKFKRGKGQLLAMPAGVPTASSDPLKRAPGTAYPEVTRTSEKTSWSTVDRGLKTTIDHVNKQDVSRFYDQEAADSKWLYRLIRMYRESRIAAKIFNESIWGSPILSDVGFTEDNLATFDAPALIREGKRLVDKRQEDCNVLVMSRELYDLITLSPKMVQYCFGSLQGQSAVTAKVLEEKFGLKVLVGEASYDTTKVGKDSSDSNLVWAWGTTYMFVGSVQSGAPENGGIGRTFCLEDKDTGGLFVPESEEDWDLRATKLRIRQDSDENTVNETAGLLIKVNDL